MSRLHIAVTGGVASGKSNVASQLAADLACKYVNVDWLVGHLWEETPPALRADLDRLLGEGTTKDQAKPRLFEDELLRRGVEDAFVPHVKAALAAELAGLEVAVVEFPLLFERGDPGEFDVVVLATAPDDVRVERAARRPGWTKALAQKVMAAQMQPHQRESALRFRHPRVHAEQVFTACHVIQTRRAVAEVANRLKQRRFEAISAGFGALAPAERVKVGVIAGSFDPLTRGHEWLIEQAASTMDWVIVGVARHPTKKYVLDGQRRHDVVTWAVAELPEEVRARVVVMNVPGDELLVTWARDLGARWLFRGLRNGSTDFTYEQELNLLQRRVAPLVSVLYLMPPRQLLEVSSSMVRALLPLPGAEVDSVLLDALSHQVWHAFRGPEKLSHLGL